MKVTERDLERLAPRLGEVAGAGLDVERAAARVTDRLRVEGGPVRATPVGRWLAMAASVALIVGAGWVTFSGGDAPPALGSPAGLTVGLSDLSVTELAAVLDSLTHESPASLRSSATLADLDAEELETLLIILEG
jgi:hypothetical protein